MSSASLAILLGSINRTEWPLVFLQVKVESILIDKCCSSRHLLSFIYIGFEALVTIANVSLAVKRHFSL